jgi:hypothetical protein
MNFKPIFIVGVGRSGTSLLQGMLNSHQEIAFPPETHFIRNYLSKVHSIEFESLKEKILNDENLLKLGISLSDVFRISNSLDDFYKNLLIEYKKESGAKFIGDKDPKNIEYLKLIHSVFPNAIVIHIYRDPRAVIASRMIAKWSKNRPFWQHILAYKSQISYGQKIGKTLFSNYIEVKYEDLLMSPEEELKKICNVINVKFELDMINFFQNSNEIVQGKEREWKENIFKPIMIENINKWKLSLSKRQIEVIELLLSNEMNQFNYKSCSSMNNLNIIKNSFMILWISLANILYLMRLK